MDSDAIGRSLLVLGAVIARIGAGILLFSRVPFLGRLTWSDVPGDFGMPKRGTPVLTQRAYLTRTGRS